MSSFNGFTKPKKDSCKTNYGNATPAEVIVGTKFSAASYINSTGTLTLDGDSAVGDVINGKTFYKDDPKTKLTGTLALDGDAIAANVLSGKTFYTTDPKTKLTGTGVLKKYASGSGTHTGGGPNFAFAVTGLSFQPSVVVVEQAADSFAAGQRVRKVYCSTFQTHQNKVAYIGVNNNQYCYYYADWTITGSGFSSDIGGVAEGGTFYWVAYE